MRRCSPTLVPGLPPTGVAGVGSFRPTPGAFMLTRTMLAAATLPMANVDAAARAQARRVLFTDGLHGAGRGGVRVAVADHERAVLELVRGDLRHQFLRHLHR